MSANPGSMNQPNHEPVDIDPTGEDLSAADPGADQKVQLQLAIFEVTRDAKGKNLEEIRALLQAAFSRRGIESPPETWLESVASSAFYGEPYIVDLPTAVAADAMLPAPDKDVRKRLAARRRLRQEKLPAGIFPPAADWDEPGRDPAAPVHERGRLRQVLAAAGIAAAVLVAVAVVRLSRRPRRPALRVSREGSQSPSRATASSRI